MQERVAGCRTFPGAGYISLLFYNHFVYPVYIRRTESWLRWLLKLSVLHITNLWGPRAFMAQVEAPWRGAVPWTTTSSTPQLLLWGSTTSENAQRRALGREKQRKNTYPHTSTCVWGTEGLRALGRIFFKLLFSSPWCSHAGCARSGLLGKDVSLCLSFQAQMNWLGSLARMWCGPVQTLRRKKKKALV